MDSHLSFSGHDCCLHLSCHLWTVFDVSGLCCRPTAAYAPWFNVVLKCARLAIGLLKTLSEEVPPGLASLLQTFLKGSHHGHTGPPVLRLHWTDLALHIGVVHVLLMAQLELSSALAHTGARVPPVLQ